MTRSRHRVLLASLLVLAPTSLRAQELPQDKPVQTTSQEEQARPTGLPSRIKWTFNFDAGWGSFGFATRSSTIPRSRGRRKPQRPVVRGLCQTGTVGHLHVRIVERDLRQVQRRRRAHLWLGAGGVRPGRLVVRARGSLHRLAIRKVVDGWRERARLQRRADRSTAWVTVSALRRRGRRRQPRRLLDQRAQGLRVRGDRPLQAGTAQGRGLLSRQGRARGERQRQPAVGRQLRIQHRREHDARRDLHEVVRRCGDQTRARRTERVQPARLHGSLPEPPDLSFEVEYASERNGEALDSNAWTFQWRL